MPKVKVKTLNDGDQLIDFEEHMTVFNLKESISERLNISPDHQRLIYCGRVLHNDKKLEEYDLDNKVIHLVNSPPNLDTNNDSQNRQSNANNQSSNGSSSDSNQETTIPSSHISININLNGANVHSNARSRFSTLYRILNYINIGMDKLEQNPNVSPPSFEQTFEANLSEENNSTSTRTNPTSSNSSGSNSMPVDSIAQIDIFDLNDQRRQTGDSGIINDEIFNAAADQIDQVILNSIRNQMSTENSTAGSSTTNSTAGPSTTSSTANTTSATINENTNTVSASLNQPLALTNFIGSFLNNIMLGHRNNLANLQTTGNTFSNTSQQSSASGERNRQTNEAPATDANQSTTTNRPQSNARTTTNTNHRVTWAEYAEFLEVFKLTQERFNPHLNSFQQSLLRRHGSLSHEEAEQEQVKYRLIARCMHHLAHVYHLLSDFYVNYIHQQDQTIQVFEPLNPPMRRPPTDLRMTNGSIIVGSTTAASLGNLLVPNTASSTNAQRSTNTNQQTEQQSQQEQQQQPQVRIAVNRPLSNSFMFANTSNQTTNSESTNNPNSTERTQSSIFILPNSSHRLPQNSNHSSSSGARDSTFQQNLLQSIFGTSLPNLSSSNVIINGQQRSNNSNSINNLSSGNSTGIRVSDRIDIAPNGTARQPTSNTSESNQSNLTSSNSQPTSSEYWRNLFNTFDPTGANSNTTSSTQDQSAANNSTSNAATNQTTNQTTNPTSNANSIANGLNFRIPPTNNPVNGNIRNFDPFLPCASNWLIPEMRGHFEVEMTMDLTAELIPTDLNSLRPVLFMSNNLNSATNSSSTTQATRTRSTSDQGSRSQVTESSSLDTDTLELFNEIKHLFSSYLGQEELLMRINTLPVCANNSLSSFIDSMNISNLISKNKSNITLELFMILAKKISVIEFLKIIFRPSDLSNFKCLNRAQESMVNYARTNLLFSTEEPFDTSSYVDDQLKMWREVLLNSFKDLEFSERTFSALMSELRANLSVFLRTFTRTFDNTENSNFALTIYSAIQRLFLDFHTSLSQMFRSPDNVMRAYKNILIHIFPNKDVRQIVIAILSYRIPAIDETERTTLDLTRFNERVLKLSDQTEAADRSTVNKKKKTVRFEMENQASTSNSSTSASSSDYHTPMEIDADDYKSTFLSERWHLDVPRSWIKTLMKDREKIATSTNKPRFSSMYRQAYKRN